ncbi:MAG: hypothetical protein J6T92_01265 [Ottowia sp.]|nr:hypothetical protein [Ottowia sp.]
MKNQTRTQRMAWKAAALAILPFAIPNTYAGTWGDRALFAAIIFLAALYVITRSFIGSRLTSLLFSRQRDTGATLDTALTDALVIELIILFFLWLFELWHAYLFAA